MTIACSYVFKLSISIVMNFEALEHSNSMDFKDYLSRDWTTQPSYVWIRRTPESDEECLRVVSLSGPNHIILEKGRWMAPIPVHDRRNRRISLAQKYPAYNDVYLPDGQKFLNVLRNRKETSDIVAWKASPHNEKWCVQDLITANDEYIMNQKWKCRYCNHVNQGTNMCQGTYFGQLPHGGPPKAQNNVLAEYEYFLSKPVGCPPVMYPFVNETHLGWYNHIARSNFQKKSQQQVFKCNAHRCVDYTHINQSDQILSFPRAQWNKWGNTYVTNTEQFYLPGAMLGHQTTQSETICPKCRNQCIQPTEITFSRELRTNTEHSWWIIETLYWLKVDIYNKKMQKLSKVDADARYQFIKNAMIRLNALNIDDFVYYSDNGVKQTVPFNMILKHMLDWISDKAKYDSRFERKRPPPGFARDINNLSLKF